MAVTTDGPRSPDAKPSKPPAHSIEQASLDNFDPADALEVLHTEVVQLEAFVHAAGGAVTRLPYTTSPAQRRDFARIYALVSKVATDATAAARHGDKLIAGLSSHLDNRRSSRARSPSTNGHDDA